MSVLIPAALLASGPLRVEKTIVTSSHPSVTVSNVNGRIEVRGWDKAQVHAVSIISSPLLEVDVETLPAQGLVDKVQFTTNVVDRSANASGQTADYTLEIPVGSTLEISNPQGSLRVEMIQGDTDLRSIGGTITASDIGGHLSVKTVTGNIEVRRPTGRVEANSTNGDVHFINPSSSEIRAITYTGEILYEGDFIPNGDYELTDYSGDVRVQCPATASFELDAKTVRGKIQNDFPLVSRHHFASPINSGSSLLGTYSTGKATLQVRSFSGTIRIRPQP